MFSTQSLLAALALLAVPAIGQVTTDCNPMEKDCPSDPAFGMDYTFDFTKQPSAELWEEKVRGVTYDSVNGAAFAINEQGDCPTLRTKFYFFGGRTEMHLKVAGGTGVISSMMWLSDNLDEVDYEFFGSKPDEAATNIFGKGVLNYEFGIEHKVGSSVLDDFHNYTTIWTKEKIEWHIDGKWIRTILAKDAVDPKAGDIFPQTPMRLSLGIWAGGDPRAPSGTREWAGGDTDYSKGPYTMYVKKVQVTDYSSGKEYSFGDRSASWDSIKITPGKSRAQEVIEAGQLTKADDDRIGIANGDIEGPGTLERAGDKWKSLSTGAKAGIIGGVGGAAALLAGAGLFYFFKQRKHGKQQAQLAEAQYNAEKAEENRLRRDGVNPDAFMAHGTEYNPNGAVRGDVYNSPPSSLHEMQGISGGRHDGWDPVSGGGGGGASGIPLLQSPTGYAGAAAVGGAGSAMAMQGFNSSRSPGPGSPPPMFPPPTAPTRSVSSPRPQEGYENLRTQSPPSAYDSNNRGDYWGGR